MNFINAIKTIIKSVLKMIWLAINQQYQVQQNPYLSFRRTRTILKYQHLAMISDHKLIVTF
ncbi:MAG: hypothetical protein PVH88_13705 [Ignavibacteria bacterium]